MSSVLNIQNIAEKRDTLKVLINNCLELIKENKLLLKKTGKNYTQSNLADFLKLNRVQDISNAKQGHTYVTEAKMKELLVNILAHFPEIQIFTDLSAKIKLDDVEHNLDELSRKIALNLFDISTRMEDKDISFETIFEDTSTWTERLDTNKSHRERFIAIVGAGASAAATAQATVPIPTTKQAADFIKKKFRNKVEEKLIDAEINRLTNIQKKDHLDFETQIMALGRFSKELVIEGLQELCGNRHTPALAYEILAHMFKHRFIDVIINFNYDETLDNAILEELPNRKDYRFIFTAGQCPRNLEDILIDKRIKQPIYIKCHGTISRPNSLRFSNENGFVMEKAIQDHISQLLLAELPPITEEKLQDHKLVSMPVNLIVLGFSMRDHVLNTLIKDAIEKNPHGIKIWIFDTNPEVFFRTQQMIEKQGTEGVNSKVFFFPLSTDPEKEDLTHRLKTLWDKIYSKFKNTYKPKDIHRHHFINKLFSKISPVTLQSGEDEDAELNYYRDRLLVEIAIQIILSNRMLHLSQVPDSRIGKYLALLEETQKKKGQLNEIKSIHYYFRLMGLEPYENFMYDTYLLSNKSLEGDLPLLANYLRKKLMDEISTHSVQLALVEKLPLDEFIKQVKNIRHRRLLMVNPRYEHPHGNLFSKLPLENIMTTNLGWINNYRKNIDVHPETWDLMLTISEKGGFLKNDFSERKFKNKFFQMIFAADGIHEHDESGIPKEHLLSGYIKYRPWWLHNKHMVLFMKRRLNINEAESIEPWEKTWELKEGFFFRQSMPASRISPVKLTAPEDLKKLLYIFAVYWHGSTTHSSLQNQKSIAIDIITKKSLILETITEILEPYDDVIKK